MLRGYDYDLITTQTLTLKRHLHR